MPNQPLIEFLSLERLEENIFRGESKNLGTPQVYGGQVLGQALGAAQHTVENREAHSVHAYFLRRGDFDAPIIYQVDRSRDGGSFSSRRVVAIQHGQPIFTMSASFQSHEEGLDYFEPQNDMPAPPESSTKVSAQDYNQRNEATARTDFGFSVSLADSYEVSRQDQQRNRWWIKTREELEEDTSPAVHKALLAYISDGGLLNTALKPHGYHPMEARKIKQDMILASLDHAMWFHRPFRADEWLLYDTQAVSTGNGRGLARAAFYNVRGQLIATCMQEGMTRLRKP